MLQNGTFSVDCILSSLNCVRLFVMLWTVASQAPLSMGFSRQECWSGLLFPSLGDLPDPGIKPMSRVPPALAGGFFTTWPPGNPMTILRRKLSVEFFLISTLSPTCCYSFNLYIFKSVVDVTVWNLSTGQSYEESRAGFMTPVLRMRKLTVRE